MPPSASGYLRYLHRESPFHAEEKSNASDAKVKRNIRMYFCSLSQRFTGLILYFDADI